MPEEVPTTEWPEVHWANVLTGRKIVTASAKAQLHCQSSIWWSKEEEDSQ